MQGKHLGGRIAKRVAVTAAALVVFAISATSAPSATEVRADDTLERALVKRVNDIRAAHGLRRLRSSAALTNAATRHARSMAGAGYFKHELYTPKRSVTWTPLPTWIRWYWPGPGYTSWAAGENLAWGAPDISARAAVRWWMNSPPHRANILTPGWRRIGAGAVHVSNPSGYFDSWSDVTIAAVEFGRRS